MKPNSGKVIPRKSALLTLGALLFVPSAQGVPVPDSNLHASLAGASLNAVNLDAALLPPVLTVQAAAEFRAAFLRDLTVEGNVLRLAPGASVGVLESAPITPSAPFSEVLPSWNAAAPRGGWLSLEVRAYMNNRWTKYYSFGRWSNGVTSPRGSLKGQGDVDGDVHTDVLILRRPATRLQYRLTLHEGEAGSGPGVRLVTFTATDGAARMNTARAAPSVAWGRVLNVPPRSQMQFPQGEGWCSPTSVSMVLAYWGTTVTVPEAAAGTFDKTYGGTGNWAFNAAYAASLGFTAYATRFSSLAEVERHILAGVPVVLSVGWGKNELPNAPVPSSGGHLLVAVGFDGEGNLVVNDPAAREDAEVRRVYDRAIFERLWLSHSGGAAYVIRAGDHTAAQ